MKLLKAFTNSLASSVFFCILLSLLIYNLNINLNFKFSFFAQLTLTLVLSYGLIIFIACFIVFFLFQFFFDKKIKIAIISPSFLSISFSFILFLFLLIFMTNYKYFLSVFSAETSSRLKSQMIIFLFVAVLGLIIFYVFYRYRKSPLLFWTYFVLLGIALAFAVLIRLNYPLPSKPAKIVDTEVKKIDKKIIIIGLEGLSFEFIIPLISEGKLPNFSWFVEEGSWGKLESFSPNEPVVLHNSFNSGKFPSKHRQISLYSYRPLYCKDKIEVVPRYILFRQLIRFGQLKSSPQRHHVSSYVKDIWEIFEDNKITYIKKDWPYKHEIEILSERAEKSFIQFFQDLQYETSETFLIAKEAFYKDYDWELNAYQEKTENKPQLFYFLLNGLNIVETYFYKYSFPDLFGNIDQEEINKFGLVIEKYYQYYDQILGKYLASLKEDELLIVYSPHGIEPLPLWKRFIEWILGNRDVSAYHEHAPEGAILFYGKGIAKGKNVEGMKIIDVAPTILYYLGFSVGRDMDGIVRSSIFKKEFTAENPISYISSYEEIPLRTPQ